MIPEAHLQSACCEIFADLVRTTGSGRLRVTGCSMLPAIHPGDVLTIERRTAEEMQPGQIVLCIRDGKLTAHRVTKVAADYLVTRGDSLPASDLPIQFPEVLGRVLSIHRGERTVSPEFSTWKRMIATMLRRSELFWGIYIRLRSRISKLGTFDARSGLRAR